MQQVTRDSRNASLPYAASAAAESTRQTLLEGQASVMADGYLGSTLHDTHQVACLVFSDDSNGVLVDRVEGDELGALIVVPQSVLVLIALCQHLSAWRNVLIIRPYQTKGSSHTSINTCSTACLPKPNTRGSLESAMIGTHCYM